MKVSKKTLLQKFSVRLILLFSVGLLPQNALAQYPSKILIDEYYFSTPIDQILHDFKTKYHVKIQYDSARLSHYNFSYLFSGTKVTSAISILFRDNPDLSYYYGEDSVIYIITRVTSDENQDNPDLPKVVIESKPYEGKAEKTGVTVSGIVRDHSSGEPLPFASIVVASTRAGTNSNVDGYFTLFNVPTDTSTLLISYVGYGVMRFYLTPQMDLHNIPVELVATGIELKGVEISNGRDNLIHATQDISFVKMTPLQISDLPSLGEKDLFRSFQLMPGISGSNESSAGLYVRGGTPDQNLILYDGFTVYHQEHLYGVFSAFNSNAIKDAQLFKGGYEAKYGGRLSSVMEIIGKTGNTRKFNMGADLSLLGFDGFVEIPLNKKGSVYIAARRSYKTFLYKKIYTAFNKNSTKNQEMPSAGPGGRNKETADPTSYFYDINAKFTYNITKKDVISLSFFHGKDVLDNSRDFNRAAINVSIAGEMTDITKWGNTGGSIKWSRKWNEKLYTNTLASYSKYFSLRDHSNDRSVEVNGTSTDISESTNEDNNLQDISLKTENEYKISSHNQLEFGLHYTNYNVNYSYLQNDTSTLLNMKDYGNLLAVYVQDRMRYFDRLSILPGFRVTYFSETGKVYAEPRIQMGYNFTRQFKLKAAWGLYHQFVNRIIREDIMSGSRDIWVLSNGDNIPVGKATHYIAGLSYETKNYLFEAEGYYKDLKGLSEYTLRFTPQFGSGVNYSSLFYKGEGYTRGIEFLLQKKAGNYSGWLGYTLSETRYHFPVYGDHYFAAAQDVTHEFKIINTYRLKKHWSFSATWIFATGKPYTEPLGGYTLTMLDGNTASFILAGSKNAARYPNYHRLDFSAKYNFRIWGDVNGDLGLSIFNVYNHSNIWYKEFEIDETGLTETDVKFLGITPNISFSIQLK
jgi:hypothetical protein